MAKSTHKDGVEMYYNLVGSTLLFSSLILYGVFSLQTLIIFLTGMAVLTIRGVC